MKRREFLAAAAAATAGATVSALTSNLPKTNAQQTESNSKENKSFVFVIDQNRCDGCQMCTEACQTEMQVPPNWGGQVGYAGKQAWIQVFDMGDGVFLPVPCQNCQNAPCAKVCPVGATYYNEDHLVLIDQNRCIGCRYCVVACPYERRFFNWFDPPVLPEDANATYSPEYNIPHRKGVAEKCIWCAHRVDQDTVPACVEACAKAGMKALWFGDASQNVASNGVDVTSLSSLLEKRGAYKLHEELGTLPQVLYLPPEGNV